jgi:hypothetical protein
MSNYEEANSCVMRLCLQKKGIKEIPVNSTEKQDMRDTSLRDYRLLCSRAFYADN